MRSSYCYFLLNNFSFFSETVHSSIKFHPTISTAALAALKKNADAPLLELDVWLLLFAHAESSHTSTAASLLKRFLMSGQLDRKLFVRVLVPCMIDWYSLLCASSRLIIPNPLILAAQSVCASVFAGRRAGAVAGAVAV